MEALLLSQRKDLVTAEYNSYSPDHFPGSAGWRKNFAACKAVEAFDTAHPEVAAYIAELAKKAKVARALKDVAFARSESAWNL